MSRSGLEEVAKIAEEGGLVAVKMAGREVKHRRTVDGNRNSRYIVACPVFIDEFFHLA